MPLALRPFSFQIPLKNAYSIVLKDWIKRQLKEKKVEPNSGLGQALRYVLKHWTGLTRFLTIADCPLDNKPAERAVLLRKNALFYRNEHGASEGGNAANPGLF